MGPGAALIGFFTALPDLVNLIQKIWTWIDHVSGNDPQGWIKSVSQAMSQLNDAETVEDRQNAAKAIAELISKMG